MKLIGKNIYIRPMEVSDAAAMLELQTGNREFFQTYTPLRIEGFYTIEGQIKVIEANIEQSQNDTRYSLRKQIN